MSHKLIYIPIKEMKKNFENKRNQDVLVNDKHHSNKLFLVSFVQHYLYRPEDLEDFNMLNFFTKYEIKRKTKHNEEEAFQFLPQHPTVDLQCVCERIETVLPKIMNFEFPDSMNLGKKF